MESITSISHLNPEPSDHRSKFSQSLWLVNQPEHVPAVIRMCQSQRCRPATSHWRIEQQLKRAGLDVIQLEEMFTPQLCSDADTFMTEILSQWYWHKDMDFSDVDGISLGCVHEYEQRHSSLVGTESLATLEGVSPFMRGVIRFMTLITTVKPSEMYHDLEPSAMLLALEIVAAQMGVRLCNMTESPGEKVPSIKSKSQRSFSLYTFLYKRIRPTVARCRAWCLWFGYKLSGSKRPVIAMIFYHCLIPTKDRLKRKYTILNVTPGWLWDTPGSSKRQQILQTHCNLKTRWQEICVDPSYLKQFVFHGIDCRDFFIPLFTNTVNVEFLLTLNRLHVIENLFRQFDVKTLVVHSDEPNIIRLCVLIAQRLSIKNIAVQHGLFAYSDVGDRDLQIAEHACVGSEYDADVIKRICPDHKVDVIGHLQLDSYSGQKQQNKPADQIRENSLLRILVLTATTDLAYTCSRSTESEIYLSSVVDALNTLSESVDITFKLHPSEKQSRYLKNMKYLDVRFAYRFITGRHFSQILQHHDLVISTVSTGVAEALYLGKPVIYLATTRSPVPLMFKDGKGLAIAHDSEELARLIQPAIRDYAAYIKQYDFKTPLSHIGPLDGQAARRLEQIIERELSQQQAGEVQRDR